jgi:hypothetical protein
MQEDRPNMNQRVANKLSEQSPSTSTAFPHMGFAKSTGSIAASPMSVADNVTSNDEKNRPKKKPKEQPKDKPKRPLSAYNLFFKHERGEILRATPDRVEGKPRRSHGKIGFADLARNIAANWKSIDAVSRAHFDRLAAKDIEQRWRNGRRSRNLRSKRRRGSILNRLLMVNPFPWWRSMICLLVLRAGKLCHTLYPMCLLWG